MVDFNRKPKNRPQILGMVHSNLQRIVKWSMRHQLQEGWNDITEEDTIDNLSEANGYLPFKEYKRLPKLVDFNKEPPNWSQVLGMLHGNMQHQNF